MTPTEQEFFRAVATLHRHPLMKLLRPGAMRFAKRTIARHRGQGTPCEAELFFGQRMSVVLPEVISEALFSYGLFDETVTWMVLQSVRPGDIVIDVGAHFGYFSLLCAHLVGPHGMVYAFEPTPSTYEVLADNARRTGIVTAMNCAAGERSATIPISDYGLKYCAWNTLASESRMPTVLAGLKPRSVEVAVVTLDDFVQERRLAPAFIKIDAEDFEREVVNGLEDTLVSARPTVLLESGSDAAFAAGQRLGMLGYRFLVSTGPGSLMEWPNGLADANARFKDLLFCSQDRLPLIARDQGKG